jgi:hypothetical protein
MNLPRLRRLLQLINLLQGGRQHNTETLARECEAEVLQPPELRRIVAGRAARMLCSYPEFAASEIPSPPSGAGAAKEKDAPFRRPL